MGMLSIDLRRRLAREVVLPGLAVTAGIAALGRVIMGPLRGFPQEDVVNTVLAERRSPWEDRLTWAVSTYTDVVPTIVISGVYGWVAYRRTGDWREGIAPGAAISLETTIFMTAAALTRRPRPDVEWLDRPAPTTSFPSGHTGATTAMHTILGGTLRRAGHPVAPVVEPLLRWVLPPTVGYSRLYRGMHHPSDVVVGLALGQWCAHAARRGLGLR